ncbi:hypothetical protein Acidovoranil_21750 [Acidovorax sp. FG27]
MRRASYLAACLREPAGGGLHARQGPVTPAVGPSARPAADCRENGGGTVARNLFVSIAIPLIAKSAYGISAGRQIGTKARSPIDHAVSDARQKSLLDGVLP